MLGDDEVWLKISLSCDMMKLTVSSNAWYRVRPTVVRDPSSSRSFVQFQYPVAPGDQDGGWMVPPKEDAPPADAKTAKLDTFSLGEIAKHNKMVCCLTKSLSL